MTCVQCGNATYNDTGLCYHHPQAHGEDYAAKARAMCDFIHRRIEPPPVVLDERSTEWPDVA